jgi:hypothetical protein
MMVTVDALQGFHAHREEAGCLPEVRATLHKPSCCGVSQRVRADTFKASSFTCSGKTF